MRAIHQRDRQATRAEKRAILDEFTQGCGYHRIYAIGLLNRPGPPHPRPRPVPRRRSTYSEAVLGLLARLWAASGYLCAARLKAAIPHWLPWMRPRWQVTPAQEAQLLAISPRQIDRRLQRRQRTLKRRLYGTTRPGPLLQQLIPIKTDHWDVTKPG